MRVIQWVSEWGGWGLWCCSGRGVSGSVAKAPRGGIGGERRRGISTFLLARSGSIGVFAPDSDKCAGASTGEAGGRGPGGRPGDHFSDHAGPAGAPPRAPRRSALVREHVT